MAAKNVQIKIDDRVWKKILRKFGAEANTNARVGVLQSKGGSKRRKDGITMVELAAIHEFGAPKAGIPERSFIRRTFRNKKKQLSKRAAKLAHKLLESNMTFHQAMGLLGLWGATEVKKTITSGKGVPPPLDPATVRQKGSTRPLVDTGQLLNSISHEVRKR